MTINNVITGAWAIIFLANTFIFLFLGMLLTLILSQILIGFGIAFSVLFPLKAPAYFASREFRKYDWRIGVLPHVPKGE